MSRDPRYTRSLEAILKEECQLQARYIDLLTEERAAITKMRSDRVSALASARETLSYDIKIARDKRVQLLSELPDSKGAALGDLIEKHFTGQEKARLLALRNELRELVQRATSLGRETNQVVNFSLNFINGSLSIIWSATQTPCKSYGRSGVVKDSGHTASSLMRQV